MMEKEREYWDNRYASGRSSGLSLEEVAGRNRRLWRAIERELPEVNHIIDIGCGDLKIWGDRACEDYMGIDIAMEVLQENKNKHPNWKFICVAAEVLIPNLVRENVFCLNVMYHILSPENANRVVRNICRYASKRIFVYTWIRNPFAPKVTDGKYQYYHPMGRLLPLFNREGFELTSLEYIEDPSALYIFKRESVIYEKYPMVMT